MKLVLISIKDYCKKLNITDAGVRKQIKNKKLNSCIYSEQLYIIIEDRTDEQNKSKIKLLNSNIKAIRNELKQYTKQDVLIQEQKIRILKLEDKLDIQMSKKEELYEKVIGHITQLELKK